MCVADLSVERQLAHEQRAGRRRLQLAGGDQDRQCQRQIVGGSLLGQLGRCQVGGDPPQRIHQAAVLDRRAHPLAGLFDRRGRQANQEEVGQALIGDIHLDLDQPSFEAKHGGGGNARQHFEPTVGHRASPQASRRRHSDVTI